MKDKEPSLPIQEEGMKDKEPSLPIQEEGNFRDINKQVNHKQAEKQEEAEPPCPPAENKTALQVDLEDGKRFKRKKRRKRKQKKTHQTPSTFTKSKCEWKDCVWTLLIILGVSTLLVTGTAAMSAHERSAEEVPKFQAQRSEDPTYKSTGKDMCTATCKVSDPPIVLKLDESTKVLNTDIRCPNKEENSKISTCFQNNFLKVSFKKGEDRSLYIEHGTGRDQSIYLDMNNEACYSSVEDQAATPTPKPDESKNDETKKGCTPSVKDCLGTKSQDVNDVSNFSTKSTGVGGMKNLWGIGALALIFIPLGALYVVVKDSRIREIQFSRLTRRPAANTENGDVGDQV